MEGAHISITHNALDLTVQGSPGPAPLETWDLREQYSWWQNPHKMLALSPLPPASDSNVFLTCVFQVDILSNSSHLPLTLLFSSYKAANWIVKLPEDVSVAHVFLVS